MIVFIYMEQYIININISLGRKGIFYYKLILVAKPCNVRKNYLK
jgi:hypothetical protein